MWRCAASSGGSRPKTSSRKSSGNSFFVKPGDKLRAKRAAARKRARKRRRRTR